MARGIAHVVCKVCGEKFERVNKYCSNRKAANDWVKYVESSDDNCCRSCWRKLKIEEEKKAGLIAKVYLGSVFDKEAKLWFVLYGDTYPIKDDLKKIGAKWSFEYPVEDMGSPFDGIEGELGLRPSRWNICCKLTDETTVYKTRDDLKGMGFTVDPLPNKRACSYWLQMAHRNNKPLYEKVKADIESNKKKEEVVA